MEPDRGSWGGAGEMGAEPYPAVCRFDENGPSLEERLRAILERSTKEREPTWLKRG